MASPQFKDARPRPTPGGDPGEGPNRFPGGPSPRPNQTLADLAEAYLRLCPDDAEVRRVRDRLESGTENPGDLRGCA